MARSKGKVTSFRASRRDPSHPQSCLGYVQTALPLHAEAVAPCTPCPPVSAAYPSRSFRCSPCHTQLPSAFHSARPTPNTPEPYHETLTHALSASLRCLSHRSFPVLHTAPPHLVRQSPLASSSPDPCPTPLCSTVTAKTHLVRQTPLHLPQVLLRQPQLILRQLQPGLALAAQRLQLQG